MSAGLDEPGHLVVGRVTKPHGTKGEVFVWPLTDTPDEVFRTGRILWLGDEDGALTDEAPELEVTRVRPFKRGVLVSFEGAGDRDAVEGWSNRYLHARRSELSEPEEGETYYHDLVGLEVETSSGERVGRIRVVYESAPADLLEVEAEDGRRRMIPLSKQVVREVDVEGGRLVIEPPAGLLDL